MDDILLVGCGGGASSVLDDAGKNLNVRSLRINANSRSSIPLADDQQGCFGDPFLAWSLAIENVDAIRDAMRGMRIVIVFSVLGGGTGTGMVPVIIQCARDCGCRVVSVMGLPMVYEADRRSRAMEAMPGIIEKSDRTLILDLETLNRLYPNVKVRNLLPMVSRILAFSTNCMADVMEGPFFSTFPEKLYTFAYTTDLDPSNAVRHATDASMFRTDPAYGKMIIMVSSGYELAETEGIFNTVVGMTGIIPEIVKRGDKEDTKVLVFLPARLDH